jgi:ubiquinone/menaquinone biosynthesis C-methylase UbiE
MNLPAESPSKLMALAQNPSGLMGRIFGKLMEWTNANAYRKAIQTLAPARHERFLELGFGTGRFAEMLLLSTTETFLAGLDPSATMVRTAIDRFSHCNFSDRIDFREGTDQVLPWGDGQFDAVIAIHCFQFWQDPDRSMAEIGRVLRPGGRIVIVFRDHSAHAPDWLPNPISRSGQEIELATQLLEKHAYIPIEHVSAGGSRIIRADRN